MEKSDLEVWQRGPIPGITPLLQPVAHALLQAREELNNIMLNFPRELLWQRPAGVASPAFHLQHLSGVVDRLFTYARGESLTTTQRSHLQVEKLDLIPDLTIEDLLQRFDKQVDAAIEQLRRTPAESLADPRGIGAKKIPTTVGGLLFHAAEHTMRHIGQLYVTVRVLAGN
jgi:uncharacterized damage-inducible protein DinB